MLTLPLELILQCLHFAKAKDLINLRKVCSFLQQVTDIVYTKQIIVHRSNANFLIEILPDIVSNAKQFSLSETLIILDDTHRWNTNHKLFSDIDSYFEPRLNKVVCHTYNYIRVRNCELELVKA